MKMKILWVILLLTGNAAAISMNAGFEFGAIGGSQESTINNGFAEYTEQIDATGPFSMSKETMSEPTHFQNTNLALMGFALDEGSHLNVKQTLRTWVERGTVTSAITGKNSAAGIYTVVNLGEAWFTTDTGLLAPRLINPPVGEITCDRTIFYSWLDPATNQYKDDSSPGTVQVHAGNYVGITDVLNGIYLKPLQSSLEIPISPG